MSRKSLLATAVVLTALATAAGVLVISGAKQQALGAQPSPSANTAVVQKRTLSAMVSQPGTLTHTKHWATIIPTEAWAGGIAASVIIGALAGLAPALRASRLSPIEALWAV